MLITMSERGRAERSAEWPMVMLSLIFLAVYAVLTLAPDLSPGLRRTLTTVNQVIWVVFVVEYVARLSRTHERWRYVRRHPLELAAVALPPLRPLSLLRYVPLMSRRSHATDVRLRITANVAFGAVVLVVVCALAVLNAERSASDAYITTFGDATWWALTTVTTVGYGDEVPVTPAGRLIGVVLMLLGVVLLGTITANVSAWFVQRAQEEADQRDDLAQDASTRAIMVELHALRADVAVLRAASDQEKGSPGRS